MIGCDICFKRALWEIISFTSSYLGSLKRDCIKQISNSFQKHKQVYSFQVVKLHLFEVFSRTHEELTAVIKRCINRESLKESLATAPSEL